MTHAVPPFHATLLSLLAAAVLAGCGGGSEVGKAGAAPAAIRDRASSPQNMLALVPSSKDESPLDLRFEMTSRPRLGQPLEISLAVLSSAPGVRSATVMFESSDALQVTSGAQWVVPPNPKSATIQRHTLTLMPRREGVFYVPVVARVTQDTAALSRSFAIPVIVDGGSPTVTAP